MKKKPLVSIITPAYNVEKYVGVCIESILNQTYKNYEFIILDDCSKDGTWKVIQQYAKRDKRIKAVCNKKNLNIAANRNKGVSLAKGKYIVWQDADDISLPTRIEKLVNLMEKNPKVGICGSYMQSFDEQGDIDVRVYYTDDERLRKNIFRFSPVAQPAAIIRKKCLDEMGDYSLEFPPAEDLDMSFRIGTKYEFANVPEVLLRYREHSNSATYTRAGQQLKNTLKIRKKYSKGYGYAMNFGDHVSYALTGLVLFVPPKITIKIFKLFKKLVMSKIGVLFDI